MIAPDLLDEIVRILVHEAKPEKIILFGSQARDQARPDSDVDLLVVERTVTNQVSEIARLQSALRHLRVPMDILVTDLARLNSSWADFPGSYLYDALREGKVLYELDGAGGGIAA